MVLETLHHTAQRSKKIKRRKLVIISMTGFFAIIIVLVLMFIFGVNKKQASVNEKEYGEIVKFRGLFNLIKIRVRYPDFEISYLGKRHEDSEVFERGFDYEDFLVKNGGGEEVISWTAGTGDIGPVLFEFGGKKYTIELDYSEKHDKRLGKDEFVINKT